MDDGAQRALVFSLTETHMIIVSSLTETHMIIVRGQVYAFKCFIS
jgi:hypothetical protein